MQFRQSIAHHILRLLIFFSHESIHGQMDGRYQLHYLPALLSYTVDNYLFVTIVTRTWRGESLRNSRIILQPMSKMAYYLISLQKLRSPSTSRYSKPVTKCLY